MKNKINYALALAVLLVPMLGTKVLADSRPPVLVYNSFQLMSEGNIVYRSGQTKKTVRFCAEDLYRIADRINEVREKIK